MIAADLRFPETAPDARRRLAEIEREKRQHVDALSRLSDESAALIAAMAAEPERAADPVADADHRQVDPPSPGNMVALKVAAHRWGRSERNLKKIAADHGALHKVGGRNMIDDAKLTAAIFGRL
jgi:hypothetical protein